MPASLYLASPVLTSMRILVDVCSPPPGTLWVRGRTKVGVGSLGDLAGLAKRRGKSSIHNGIGMKLMKAPNDGFYGLR
jgi:hypothetical protein